MFSGGHCKAAFSVSYPTDVLKAAAATVAPSLTPVLANTSLSQLHRMVECVQPMNPQDLQQNQPCGQLTVRPRGGVCGPISTTDFQKTSPILMGMLTRTKDSVPPKTTSQASGKRPYLDDDEILRRINEKLAIFKARMLELSKPSRTPQTSKTSQTSAPASPENAEVCDLEATQANKLALFKSRMQKLREGSFSNKPLNSSPQTSSTSQTSTPAPGVHPQNPEVGSLRVPTEKPESRCIRPERPQGKITQTKKNSAEYGQTLKEDEDSPMVLQALSGTAVSEPVKENPRIIVPRSPADHECTLVGRSYNSHQNICTAVDPLSRVDCVPAVAESTLGKTPERKAPKASDRLPTVPDAWTAFETSEPHAISRAGHGNLLLNLSQTRPDVTFPVGSFQKVPEPEEQERTEDLQKDQAEVRTEMEPPPSESESFLKDPQYEDLTDYEEEVNILHQVSLDGTLRDKLQTLCRLNVDRAKPRRRSSSEAAHLKDHDSKRLKLNPKQRQKHPSQELLPPLMKKTILEAKQLTSAAHRKDQPPSIDQPRGEGYKWKDRSSQEHTSEDWLEQMYGERYHRPHY
uniref:Uncharacterized protein n=1 Tax=Knipowitschia caucasica TaxID=637954 RepID=A0AAV2IRS9_KNICA